MERFADLMEEKLRQNDHKAHWLTQSLDYLEDRRDQEMEELKDALTAYKKVRDLRVCAPLTVDALKEAVRHEAVDVANFIMMICEVVESEVLISRK